VNAIVPPRETPKERKVARRVKAYRCYQGCLACCLVALFAFCLGVELKPGLSIWVLPVAFVAIGMAVVAAIGDHVPPLKREYACTACRNSLRKQEFMGLNARRNKVALPDVYWLPQLSRNDGHSSESEGT
jgi:hypothetical protein